MCDEPSRSSICLGQDQYKFISAEPRGRIKNSAIGPKNFPKAAQGPVAYCVAIMIVDPLQIIHIKHENGKSAASAIGSLNLPLENAVEPTQIGQTCQRVGGCLLV